MSVELYHTLSSQCRFKLFLFRQGRRHCFCILQLNNVQAFVNVFGSGFHCESSAVIIVYTSVLESQVNHRNAGVESFSLLNYDQLRDLHPEFFERRGLAQ